MQTSWSSDTYREKGILWVGTYIDRHRYLARREKNERGKVMQESDLSEIAKTDSSLFTILGQFESPQFSIILKISNYLGLGNLLVLVLLPQSRKKWKEYTDREKSYCRKAWKNSCCFNKVCCCAGTWPANVTWSVLSREETTIWGPNLLRPQFCCHFCMGRALYL